MIWEKESNTPSKTLNVGGTVRSITVMDDRLLVGTVVAVPGHDGQVEHAMKVFSVRQGYVFASLARAIQNLSSRI
jgi:hypothetical protein